jgi:hypothetical protein
MLYYISQRADFLLYRAKVVNYIVNLHFKITRTTLFSDVIRKLSVSREKNEWLRQAVSDLTLGKLVLKEATWVIFVALEKLKSPLNNEENTSIQSACKVHLILDPLRWRLSLHGVRDPSNRAILIADKVNILKAKLGLSI